MLYIGRFAYLVCLFVALTANPTVVVWAEEPVKTNFEILKDMTTAVSEELVSGFPAEAAEEKLRLAPYGRDERYEFIANILTSALASNGYRAFAPMAANSVDSTAAAITDLPLDEELRVEFQVLDFNLWYPKMYRPFLIGGKKVKRRADVRLLVRLVDPTNGLVVWVGEASRTHDDKFSHGKIDDVEVGLYSFTKPPHESRKWGKIIEPIAVSAIVVGLIYLFFSNQSGD